MRFFRSLCTPAVLLLAASAVLSGQVVGSSFGAVAYFGPQGNKAPFTLTRTTTTVQTLADGTTLTHTSTTKQAYDSQGRSYAETRQMEPVGPDSQPDEWVHAFITDPVTHTHITWDSRTKIANVTHMPEPQIMHPVTVPEQLPRAAVVHQPPVVRPHPQMTREDLGFRTIAGIQATGSRTTQIIPTGEQGNDRPLTIATEYWRATEYGIPLLTIRDDPRTGRFTDEVSEFQPGEPDPALFQIPEGYTVKEHTAGQPE
jgi:YD repeat-containing protein